MFTQLPANTEVHTTSPIAAGLPVLEVVRRLDEEKILTREDKDALKVALYSSDPVRREKIVKALCDVELNMNSQFSIRRLKATIHQNGSGEVSSKLQHMAIKNTFNHKIVGDVSNTLSAEAMQVYYSQPPLNNPSTINTVFDVKESPYDGEKSAHSGIQSRASRYSTLSTHNNNNNNNNNISSHHLNEINVDEDEEDDDMDTKTAVQQVVGARPMYAGNFNFNVCAKISLRLDDFLRRYNPTKMGRRKIAVLTGSGSFNPLTRMHVRLFYLAKQFLESKHGYVVLGSLLSPAHSVTVRERFRTHPNEVLPPPHRLAVAQLLVQNSKWLSVDPWEITRRRAMDYLSLLEHTTAMLKDHFPETEFKVMYLCKPNLVPKLSPDAMRSRSYGLVCVCRAPESDTLRSSLGAKWNGVIYVAEDTAILDASIDTVTSRNVRDKIKANESVSHIVGEKINEYVNINRIGYKLNGLEEWTADEKQLPKISSRPPEHIKANNINNSVINTNNNNSPVEACKLSPDSSIISAVTQFTANTNLNISNNNNINISSNNNSANTRNNSITRRPSRLRSENSNSNDSEADINSELNNLSRKNSRRGHNNNNDNNVNNVSNITNITSDESMNNSNNQKSYTPSWITR